MLNFKLHLSAIADKHLQNAEKKKCMRQNKHDTTTSETIGGDTTIHELLLTNTILLPFVIDPHGNWGPIMKNFLFPTTIDTHPTFPTNRPYATIMYHQATKSPSPTALLQTADRFWQQSKTRPFFGHSYTTPTPLIHTIQQMGLGTSKAFAKHLRNSTLKQQNCSTSSSTPTNKSNVQTTGLANTT
jgi:hypothetical protein